MNNVLITGVTGLVGSNLVNSLSTLDYSPTIIGLARTQPTNYDAKKLGLNGNFITHYGDIRDYRFVDSLINKYEVDTIFHLAANAIVRTCQRGPVRAFESNIQGTWNILESARQNQTVKAIVAMSSDKYYGQTPTLPYTEDMKPFPITAELLMIFFRGVVSEIKP